MSDVARVCANECGRSFFPPIADPERTMCKDCLRELGLPRVTLAPVEGPPIPPTLATCAACGSEFASHDGATHCSACKDKSSENALAPAYLEVLEQGERPGPERDGRPLWHRLSRRESLEYAAELAADMETGVYVPEGESTPWPEGRHYNVREILRRMGYADWTVRNNRRPVWWPGSAAFKGYVDWKVRERAMLGRVTYDKLVPYIEALTFMGFAEMARRVKLEPERIPFRDLSQFAMRGVEVIKGHADPWQGEVGAGGADAYAAIGRAIEGVGDETARRAISGLLDAVLVEARARMRQVVEIPAKAAG